MGKRINEGDARLYRETIVDTSYMRIPNESLAPYTSNRIEKIIQIQLLVAFQSD